MESVDEPVGGRPELKNVVVGGAEAGASGFTARFWEAQTGTRMRLARVGNCRLGATASDGRMEGVVMAADRSLKSCRDDSVPVDTAT